MLYSDYKKLPPPRYVLWDCTRKCNLNCIHCGAVKEKYEKELKKEDVKKLIDELANLGVKTFAVTGGEPLTRPDLLNILKYASDKGLQTGIATNGFLINKEMASKIKDANVTSVQVSLDGTKETHNQIRRNQNSFDNAINAINFLNGANIPNVTVATTVSPLNLNSLEELMNILIGLKMKFWRICVVMPIGRANENRELFLSKEQLKHLFEFIVKNKTKLNIELGENLTFLGEYEEKIRDSPLMCPVGFKACCIGVDGNVRGCPEMPDTEKYREGSILEKPFIEIWNNGFKKYRDRKILISDKKCSICKNKGSCYGGCWVMREGNIQCIYDLL
jgi:radical SAM protein with 4Fe4S-binding SPASM domain